MTAILYRAPDNTIRLYTWWYSNNIDHLAKHGRVTLWLYPEKTSIIVKPQNILEIKYYMTIYSPQLLLTAVLPPTQKLSEVDLEDYPELFI